MTSSSSKVSTSVTLLHKGQGPSLFLNRSQRSLPASAYNQNLNEDSSTQASPRNNAGRRLQSHPKRVVVKCLDRQDENSMFAKRLRERAALRSRLPTSTTTPKTPVQEQQCQLYLKEQLFTNTPHKPSGFPPPNFMPRWNPRHKDRTYMSKMVLEDPWSLPPDERAELKKRTGLRLKSLSRHYQYKVGANLPYGREATSKCNCHVEYCDHCAKSHDFRCPLHMQLLDDFEPDCKMQPGQFCSFSRNAEDLPLNNIKDPGIYVTEVVRRLRVGEIKDVPPFPKKFLLNDKKTQNKKNIPASTEASSETLDHQKKTITEDTCTQTEPFIVDMDMKATFKENTCQTVKSDKNEPVMVNILKSTQGQTPYRPYGNNLEVDTQVTPCMLQSFAQSSSNVVRAIAKQTLQQAIQEISNEIRLDEIKTERAQYVQRLVDLQRTTQFKFLQVKWRNIAYYEEHLLIDQETTQEMNGEEALCAIGFGQSFFYNFPGKVMDSLRRDGFIVNEDLQTMNTTMKAEFNKLMEERLRPRDDSIKLLDEMMYHALFDLEMDAFRGQMVDAKYLNPLVWSTRALNEMIVLQDNNIDMLKRIRDRLLSAGWHINDDGELVHETETGTPITAQSTPSSSDVSLDAFLKGVRVSIDSDGNPKYLVDAKGTQLPINVRWMPVLEKQAERHKDLGESRSSWRFDIVLDDESLSDTQIAAQGGRHVGSRGKSQFSEGGFIDGENHGEGLGLDFDYSDSDNDDDDDEGRIVFKHKESHLFEDDFEDVNM